MAVMLPNVLQFPVAMAGVLRAGYTVVTVNPLYTPRELEHQLADSGAEAIVVLENFAHVLAQVLPRVPIAHTIVASMGDLFPLPKRLLVNTIVRKVKKLVPPFNREGTARKLLITTRRMTITARVALVPVAPLSPDRNKLVSMRIKKHPIPFKTRRFRAF